jgi:propionyl-CoA synthetase
MTARYDQVYRRSLDDPSGFWGEAAEALVWDKRWDRVLDDSRLPFYRWFSGGKLSVAYNALDRHVDEGNGERTALVYDSPVTGAVAEWTFRELRDDVAKVAGALRELGVTRGDRVLIYMPMIPQAAMAMLACARLGAIHSVVFGGFAAPELATRIDDATPKVVISASCGIEGKRVIAYKQMVDEAIEQASFKPHAVLMFQRPQQRADLFPGRDYDWETTVGAAAPAECVPIDATDPLYILYTSGTTGMPKGVVHDAGGYAVALRWSMKNIYNVDPGEVFWAASDVGWVVGHSYIVYAPLLSGCTTVLYEGKPVGTPDAGAFWRVVEQHGVDVLFTAPTAFRAIRRDDPDAELMHKHDISTLRTLFLAGERADPATIVWAEEKLGMPVIDHWWQTETGWAIAANCMGIEQFPVKRGSPTKAVPGWDLRVLDDIGEPVKPGEIGSLAIKLPLPPGALPTLWQADDRFVKSYLTAFPGFYATGDAGYIDEDGYVYVMTRTDDVINVAGHRLSTGAIEEVLAGHPDVAECAVIGAHDELKGQVPIAFIVLKANCQHASDEVTKDVARLVREQIGAIASLKETMVLDHLPKTRSGKILRGTMQKIANAETFKVPPTIEDASVLGEVTEALQAKGFAKDVAPA